MLLPSKTGKGGVMSERSPASKKLYRWRITRIRASPAVMIGYVEAPDEDQAKRVEITRRDRRTFAAQIRQIETECLAFCRRID